MQTYDQVVTEFHAAIELLAQSADHLAAGIEDLAALLAGVFVSDRKLVLCGIGPSYACAHLMRGYLMHTLGEDRPGLPAILLNGGPDLLTDQAVSDGVGHLARQVKALGQDGDLLLCLTPLRCDALAELVRAARDRQMQIAAISGGGIEQRPLWLGPDDLHLGIGSESVRRSVEQQIIIVHCICTTLDQLLFGADS
jgi:D-sedoheptulose 7-phosphate isomerase